MVYVVEDDDGSGWIKVVDDRGAKGLVPASYVNFAEATETSLPGPLQSHPRQGSGKYGTSLHRLLPRTSLTTRSARLI
jgi:hypothetical protein